MSRVGWREQLWPLLLGAAATVLIGAGLGALVSGAKHTALLYVCLAFGVGLGVAFVAAWDTTADSIRAIAEDYKHMLDTWQLEETPESGEEPTEDPQP